MQSEHSWYEKLVDYLVRHGAHRDELKATSLIEDDDDDHICRFGFYVVSGLVSQDNRDEWTDDDVETYLYSISRPDNRPGASMCHYRAWPCLAKYFKDAAERLKYLCLAYCDAGNIPYMSRFIQASPFQLLRCFDGRDDIDSLDRKFSENTLSESIEQWWRMKNNNDAIECRRLVDAIYCHGMKWNTRHKLTILLEKGAYLCKLGFKTGPGRALAEFAECISSMEFLRGHLEGLTCLSLTGIDYRDLCCDHEWTTSEWALVEADRRRCISKESIDSVISMRPVADLVLSYLFVSRALLRTT